MMVRLGQKEIARENSYAAKKPIKILDVNFDNIVILKLIETETNSKCLMSFRIDDEKLLEKI